MNDRGYAVMGILDNKYDTNTGTLVRSARCFGLDAVFTTGERHKHDSNTAVGHDSHIPVMHFGDADIDVPNVFEAQTVALTTEDCGVPLWDYLHPERACYVLGAEDYGFEDGFLERDDVQPVRIQSDWCLNVAIAGSVAMYDRQSKEKDDRQGRGSQSITIPEGAFDAQ